MNKRGADKIIAIYWFAVLIIIAVAVYAMVSIFYSHHYDVREVEANVLLNKVADCISYKGTINADLLDSSGNFQYSFKNNFLSKCHLNFNVENQLEIGEQYYVKVDFSLYPDMVTFLFPIEAGNKNLVASCDTQSSVDKDYRLLLKCVEKSFYATGGRGGQYIIKILSIVNKARQNVKE